ncbi:hypothetical protein CH276_18885 [Rhodococcus sp. 06-470-2]|uniref:hypothetical protein n=1 Tax=unclassified Rhodococcus (in: high G+C Gram-positive bacteria) TaxID=192944 RepID=UPI000B9B16AA|nr:MULTISPECIES: hypothetical protein [unclassified Rhodococcus (in: high G+C Gram-positive bacteria)]OZC60043.1 hypothetical protein CH276_18885 [Rhodococcus sp. 06-470-2]OZE56977.1 hypothetical protein CH265_24630 [Rhodococcus sp. 05-2221-1B]
MSEVTANDTSSVLTSAVWMSRQAADFEDPDTGETVDMSAFVETSVEWLNVDGKRIYTQTVVQPKEIVDLFWQTTQQYMTEALLRSVETDRTI